MKCGLCQSEEFHELNEFYIEGVGFMLCGGKLLVVFRVAVSKAKKSGVKERC